MLKIVENFISPEDVATVQEYISTINFNTKDNHVELHDNLYDVKGIEFDIHTRGEMPAKILDIFSKYSKGVFEEVQTLEPEFEYHPPMFSKHYIARCGVGYKVGPQSDPSKPEGTYKSYIYWNNNFEGGQFSVGESEPLSPKPGTLLLFPETESNKHTISPVTDGLMFLSEAWLGRTGQAWMDAVDYENTDWDNWEIKGF